MPTLERLRVYPVKSLDGIDLDSARITGSGTIELDREYALFADDGEPINGIRTDAVHRLDTEFDPDGGALTVGIDGEERTFALPDDRAAFEAFATDYFGESATLRRQSDGGFVDRPEAGPSVVSTATLREVASWFPEMSVDELRRRLRTNVEISGVEPFWEDRFVGDGPDAFSVGGVRFEGVEPCARCAVPERNPDTGERDPTFRERFVEKRREHYPDGVDRDAFRTDYSLTLIARVPESDRGERIAVGDEVRRPV